MSPAECSKIKWPFHIFLLCCQYTLYDIHIFATKWIRKSKSHHQIEHFSHKNKETWALGIKNPLRSFISRTAAPRPLTARNMRVVVWLLIGKQIFGTKFSQNTSIFCQRITHHTEIKNSMLSSELFFCAAICTSFLHNYAENMVPLDFYIRY